MELGGVFWKDWLTKTPMRRGRISKDNGYWIATLTETRSAKFVRHLVYNQPQRAAQLTMENYYSGCAGVLKNLVTVTRDKNRVTVNTEAQMSKR